MMNYKWYLMVLDQYMTILAGTWSVLPGIRWYRVSKGLVCLYILEKVEIWPVDTNASHTHTQQNIELLSLSKV